MRFYFVTTLVTQVLLCVPLVWGYQDGARQDSCYHMQVEHRRNVASNLFPAQECEDGPFTLTMVGRVHYEDRKVVEADATTYQCGEVYKLQLSSFTYSMKGWMLEAREMVPPGPTTETFSTMTTMWGKWLYETGTDHYHAISCNRSIFSDEVVKDVAATHNLHQNVSSLYLYWQAPLIPINDIELMVLPTRITFWVTVVVQQLQFFLPIAGPTLSRDCQAIVQVPPPPPTDLQVSFMGKRTAILIWEAPVIDFLNSLTMVSSYQLVVTQEQFNIPDIVVDLSGSTTFYLFPGNLEEYTLYSCTVTASNAFGPGSTSLPVDFRTLQDAPSAAPQALSGSAESSYAITFTWSPPPPIDINGILLYYEAVVEEIETGQQFLFSVLNETLRLSTLHPHYTYECRVRAFTTIGSGPFTDPYQVQTLEDAAEPIPTICEADYHEALREVVKIKEECDGAAFYDCCQPKTIVPSLISGAHEINGVCDDSGPFSTANKLLARCNMVTDGGGWLVIQRRANDHSIDFFRGWDDYEEGFGDLDSEFWYGLRNIHCLTTRDEVELRIDLKDESGNKVTWVYQQFHVAGPEEKYELTIGQGEGTWGTSDAMAYHSGQWFSTHDEDNDASSDNCAQIHEGGWWYNSCHHANLNGVHDGCGTRRPVWYDGTAYIYYPYIEMMVRQKTCLFNW